MAQAAPPVIPLQYNQTRVTVIPQTFLRLHAVTTEEKEAEERGMRDGREGKGEDERKEERGEGERRGEGC